MYECLPENYTQFNKALERIEVLEKVKSLFHKRGFDGMTFQQAADFYEVDIESIRICYKRNRAKLDADGTRIVTAREFMCEQQKIPQRYQNKSVFVLDNGITVVIPNRGIRVLSKRAVIHIGMLLQQSRVAEEVRLQLLNTYDNTMEHIRMMAIEESKYFSMKRVFADPV